MAEPFPLRPGPLGGQEKAVICRHLGGGLGPFRGRGASCYAPANSRRTRVELSKLDFRYLFG